MIYVLLVLLIVLIIYSPQIWVKLMLRKHSSHAEHLPGTGGELARHLLDRFSLEFVKVEAAERDRDHYDPQSNTVRLSPDYLNGKSITAVAVAAHEVGHAIQFNRKEAVSFLREKYLGTAIRIKKAGTIILIFSPLIFALLRIPQSFLAVVCLGLIIMLTSVFMYAAILPEEWDASFNKALPILTEGQYVNDSELAAVKQVLTACALTYVAAALADLLSIWRWLLILRR